MTIQGVWTHDLISTNGINLHYVTQGEGPLMLMLHGFPEFWYSWRHQIPEFARDYKVVALDLRGYNDSDKPQDADAYVMEELIRDYRRSNQGTRLRKLRVGGSRLGRRDRLEFCLCLSADGRTAHCAKYPPSSQV